MGMKQCFCFSELLSPCYLIPHQTLVKKTKLYLVVMNVMKLQQLQLYVGPLSTCWSQSPQSLLHLTNPIIISNIIRILQNELNKMLCYQVMPDGREHIAECTHDHLASSINGVSAGQEKLVLLVKMALDKQSFEWHIHIWHWIWHRTNTATKHITQKMRW